ncbi:MAG TPA: L-histidine N(alpha)-methyltransferase [Bryobacteraceae bacterium]|nr:L-histidine N(alpha)-methyltransferase [Bryobacteraceae bacterium]
MKIEVVLTESEIAQEFTESLEARDLPEKCFYWFPHSVDGWLALARDPMYEGLRQLWNAVPEIAKSSLEHLGPIAPVISFGAGDGSKDRPLLDALRASGRDREYFPIDASQSLLELACAAAEDADIETTGIKADISSPVHLVFASDAAESPKVFLMSGNSLGSFDPLEQIRHLAQCLQEGDRLIVDAEINDEGTIARHQQPAVERFAFAPLGSIGISPEDGEVKFDQKRDERRQGLFQTRRHFRALRDLPAVASGVAIARGERIAMNFQYTYTADAFRWLLAEHARLKILQESASADGRFRVAVCAR